MPDSNKQVATTPKFDATTLTGIERSAILMLSLNEQDAAIIFRQLEPKQVQRLGMAMASMKDFSQVKVAGVHRAFIDDIQKFTNWCGQRRLRSKCINSRAGC